VVERAGELRPACASHARRPGAVGEVLEADRVQQELLDAYGVEPLPAESFRPLDEAAPADRITRFLRRFDRGRSGA
jgi:hypothetical protein